MARGLLQADDPLAHLLSPAFRTQLLSHALVLLAFLLLAYAWGTISPRFSAFSAPKQPRARQERWQCIAKVDELWVYPVKSCRGTKLDDADVTKKGWDMDRRWIVWDVKRENGISLREEPRVSAAAKEIGELGGTAHLEVSGGGSRHRHAYAGQCPLLPRRGMM